MPKLFRTEINRKRVVILFLVAIVLPLLFVVGVSVDVLRKRQESNRNLLESNLWYSGRSALQQLEQSVLNLEEEIYSGGIFARIGRGEPDTIANPGPRLFMLDARLHLLYPDPGTGNLLPGQNPPAGWPATFRRQVGIAENYEKINADFSSAATAYRQAFDIATNPEQKAIALDGLARTRLASGNRAEAARLYRQLSSRYGQVQNLSGHPFGLTAPLQLHALKLPESGHPAWPSDSLRAVYRLLKEGHWRLNPASYRFFLEEYESVLGKPADSGQTDFERQMLAIELIEEQVTPVLNDRLRMIPDQARGETARFLIYRDGQPFMVSCRQWESPDGAGTRYIGLVWEPEHLKDYLQSLLTGSLSAAYGLTLSLLDETTGDRTTAETTNPAGKGFVFPLEKLPLPWSVRAMQPGFDRLKNEMKLQMTVFGILLGLIVLLMIFGVFLLIRDMGRENESVMMKTEFVHNVSHELKTPLSLIRLYGETLMMRPGLSEKDRMDALQIITKESERLSHMIGNILDFSRMEMGRREFTMQEGDLSAVVSETLTSYRYHLEKKGFAIDNRIDTGFPEIPFDRDAIEAMLINLFSNAMKYSGENRFLGIRLRQSGGSIILEVEDHGRGISPADIPHIFDRFYRSGNPPRGGSAGSGLGLALVRHTVEAHNWTIGVTSRIGEGTVFTIRIPTGKEDHHERKDTDH